jgi:hypothetical protein
MEAKRNNPQVPFLTGFVAGMAAGAAAVYFFGTEKGQDFVEDMENLWEEARPELVAQGVIANSDATMGEAIKGFLIQAFAERAAELTPPKKRIRKANTLFKGV